MFGFIKRINFYYLFIIILLVGFSYIQYLFYPLNRPLNHFFSWLLIVLSTVFIFFIDHLFNKKSLSRIAMFFTSVLVSSILVLGFYVVKGSYNTGDDYIVVENTDFDYANVCTLPLNYGGCDAKYKFLQTFPQTLELFGSNSLSKVYFVDGEVSRHVEMFVENFPVVAFDSEKIARFYDENNDVGAAGIKEIYENRVISSFVDSLRSWSDEDFKSKNELSIIWSAPLAFPYVYSGKVHCTIVYAGINFNIPNISNLPVSPKAPSSLKIRSSKPVNN